jgi:hypothetical protein
MQGASFVGGLAVGAATGGAASLGRATLGRAASSFANDEKLKEKASQGGARGMWARTKLDLARNTSSASFDARNVKIAGKDIAGATGFSVGKGQTGGFAADRKAQVEKELKYAESLKVGEDSKLTQDKYKADLAKVEAEAKKKEAKNEYDRINKSTSATQAEKDAAKKASDLANEEAETAKLNAETAKANIDKANKIRANNYAEKIEGQNGAWKQMLMEAAKGAAAGAVAGSVVPGVGTAFGTVVGAGAGAVKAAVGKSSYSEKGGQESANKVRAGVKPPKAQKKDKDGNPIPDLDTSGIIEALKDLKQNQPQAGGPNQGSQTSGNNNTQNTQQNTNNAQSGFVNPNTGRKPFGGRKGNYQGGNQNNNPTPPANPQPTPPNPPTPPTT